ncbi:hypothetical protein CP533_2371 [Ophiocordyceps camponoti-saundersi (nom. inval.)]|nr:hypothetical protein CP533_2371 [Ophiocordyceps camponoti-saundersi (nom. inval.)]
MSTPVLPFGIIPIGQPPITEPVSAPGPASFLYALPSPNVSSHIIVFLVPNITLPNDTAAAIYLTVAPDLDSVACSPVQFLGGIGPGKESAMFKIGSRPDIGTGNVFIGVSVESADSVSQRIQELSAAKGAKPNMLSQSTTIILAQRIIQNAFNFLASFSGSTDAGGAKVEVVPLKAFEEWWRKFESRLRSDPSFLERQAGET